MTETRKLADYFHDVYENSYIVLKEDAMDLLPDNIKYMHKGPLIFIPIHEKDKLLKIDPELETMISNRNSDYSIRKSNRAKEDIGTQKGSINYLNNYYKTKNNGSFLEGSNRNSIKFSNRVSISFSINDEDIKKIITKARHYDEKQIVSYYIDRRILQEFNKILQQLGLNKKASRIVELLLAEFIDKTKEELRDAGGQVDR